MLCRTRSFLSDTLLCLNTSLGVLEVEELGNSLREQLRGTKGEAAGMSWE